MKRFIILFFNCAFAVNSVVPQYLQPNYGYGGAGGPAVSGVKTKTKTKTAPVSFVKQGPPAAAPRGGCGLEPPTPKNAEVNCAKYSGCKIECLESYQFPNGDTNLFVSCLDGHWVVEGEMWDFVPSCEPICLIPCQNQGICIAPNQCLCPETFTGPYCQYENKPCMNYPQLPTNSRRSCSSKSCTISCLQGHKFPDGSSIATMSCKNGYWIPDKERWVSIPNCDPVCDPPCLNGGNCLSFGHCQCPQEFRGPQCQYRTEDCGAKRLQFNGGYNCSGDQQGLSCSIHCPEGMTFESPPASIYVCLYSEGKFLPAPIPQCVFREGTYGRPYSGNYYERHTNSTTFDLNSLSVNGFPEVSYIPPGQRWNHFYQVTPHYQTNEQTFEIVTEDPIFVVHLKTPEPGVCFTWQGTHYKSFDGKVFSFDSKCAHTLVRDAVDNTFSVIVQNDAQCNYNPTACSRIVTVYLDKKEYILKRSEGVPTFSTPKKRLPIPGQLPGLRIEMAAHYVVLSLDTVGAKIKWDGQQLVQVEVQESLWNRTEGICGNIDGDPFNDILRKDGRKPQAISNFATSWKVEDFGTECNDLPSEVHACTDDGSVGSLSHRAMLFCKKLLNDPRFASCHTVVDLSLLLDACRWDYCTCKNAADPTVCACETINVYVRSCSFKGIQNIAGWRDAETCPMQCTGGKIYKSCGSSLGQPVCGSSNVQVEESQQGCVEGCYCPFGTVLHEDSCITVDQCPCKLRAKSFPPGAQVPKECNTCTCNNGKWVCTQISCGSRCAAIGDPHYVTFDGKRFDFMGQCSYYLMKTPSLSIEAENVACSGSISQAMNLPASVSGGLPSCTKTVTLKIFGQTIKLKQDQGVVANGLDITKVPYQAGNVTIRSVSSLFLQVELPNGILIWWDGMTRAYIDIPANFQEKTGGLCGTFNNNQKDDFLTPENDIEQAVIPFANKWKTNEKCNDVPDVIKSHPCSSNIQKQPTAEQHCSKIKSNLFSSCHWIVDPEPYYQDCLYDMCSCEYKTSKCLCPTVAAYAEECSRQGIKISWRDSIRECGIRCPNGQTYQICGNTCTRTCFDVATRPDCRPQCVEGCNCPEGEALDDNGDCVPIGECKCQFDGLQFHPGYKEIRPASKGQELCTCINALWSCRLATKGEEKIFPKANDLKSLCGASENMEFTTCEPPEPVTCKNMHNDEQFSAMVCHPGCKCTTGYVLDSSTKKCVRPSECPCHHGGRSYKEGAVVPNDCNTCKCQNGTWTCTDRPCSAECSAWGDSHFKTFDGKHFDFQGQCDYALSKGTLESSSFDVIIQNVPCGSLGTSCSKAVTIRIKSGQDQDVIALTKDKSLPVLTSLKHATVRQKGLFVIMEAPDLGLVVQWDKGTRVYVKVDPRWKDRVKGLCGNYNDNDADDFQTPSGGITEASALIFGDSWKLQAYCPEALEITNTCEDRPDRRVWALKQCGVLKSSVFARCHSEVSVDIYLEKCIFDACACDQGGDCECLCTALAAYAQECNIRGVPIKWRSQKLCPMQCDERCSNYSPCTSTCPIETCDNFLTEVSKTCKEETCIEGCEPKPCPPDHIYLNSSLFDCVPRKLCKPVCMEIDGITYNEGDLVEGDECHSCYCSRGEKVCKGQPCTTPVFTTTVLTTHRAEQQVLCQSGWTGWINQDKGKPLKTKTAKKKNDFEPLPTSVLLNNLKGAKCDQSKMIDIQCRTVNTHKSAKDTGLDAECSLERGLVCKSGQWKPCQDFEIRVLCQCEPKTTTLTPKSCDPDKPHREHSTDCHLFYHCEDSPDGPKYVEKTCGPSMYFNPVTMICDWPYAVEEIKPECKAPTTTETITEVKAEAEIEEPEKLAPLEAEISQQCPPGTKEDDCAIQCDRLCLYYSYILKSEGFCKNDEKCVSGCVNPEKYLNCPKGKLWSNNDTCVDLKNCLCRSNDGRPIKPGTVYRESDCRVCQCIDNYYSCDESSCPAEGEGRLLTNGSQQVVLEGNLVTIIPPWLLSTVTPPEKCDEDHFIDLMQGDQALPDVVLNASSVLSSAFEPSNARFDSKVDSKSGGSWIPQYSNNMQFLEIDLGQQEPVYGIKIKGSPMYDEYVTSYKVFYSPDGYDGFLPVLNKERLPQVFRGSIDPHMPVREIFDIPFEAKVIKIHPETWHTGIALKVELIGCGEPTSTTVPYEFITIPKTLPPMCDEPMGLDDGTMSETHISVSSEVDRNHGKMNLRLNNDGAWQPVINSPTEFVQFDFLEPRNITGVETKGGPGGWVVGYVVKYSQDDISWSPVIDKYTKTNEVFVGNFDSDTPQINYFHLPLNARLIKLIPTIWYDKIQMRVEIHGCFEPYPTVMEELSTVVPSDCNICPEVKDQPMELKACRCADDKWWDGTNCVQRTECPCFVEHLSYPVGTSFKKGDCSECLCKIGGVPYCIPKHCEPCEKGLRSTVTSTCKCTCQPCPQGTRLCPTSDVCINATLWCNAIQDCPDDEIGCVTTPPTTTTVVTQKPVKTCPEVNCPPGFKKKIKTPTKGRLYQSSMFSSYSPTKTKDPSSVGVKTKGGVKKSFRKTTPMQKTAPDASQNELNCTEYACVLTKPPPQYIHSKKECPPASCPEGYLPVVEKEDYVTQTCPEYSCNPAPLPDAVCNVTGRTFNTFDETEFKYDVCDHVLASDLQNDEWEIALKKNCEKTCWRDLIIQHQNHLIVIHPNLTAEYDDFSYTAEQTKKIGSNTKSFSISRVGNTLLFVSNRYGFWIIWDKEGNLKLGVTRKLLGKVDGLCGYFNENPDDDKKKPDGSTARTTVEFGDSWAYGDKSSICEVKTCPVPMQSKAWEICQVKHQALEACNRVVNKDAFISRCIEATCECLQAATDNHTAEEGCRCNSLQDFVVECLIREPNTDISDWRTQLDCPATCQSPLVYHDCYQRRCEPTCASLSNPEAACSKLPNVCFPGCYCPSGTVKKGDSCISPSSCRDCECNVLPHLQYVTYDDTNFTINANCVYVMSRDALEGRSSHKFQVLITNAPCRNNQRKTCVGKVTLLYEGRKIHVLNDMFRNRLKLIVDGERIDDFSEIQWAKVQETASKHIKIEITDLQVHISVYYPSLGVSVKTSSVKYGGKLEGLCGDCDGNPHDDFRTPKGDLTNNTNEFALGWLYDKLPGGQTREQCENKIEDCASLPKESDPCQLILDYKTFGQCLRVLDPSLFLEWCKKDTCDDHPELACNAIEAYARDCASSGFCVNWRTNICPPKDCPSDKIYNPCGTTCPKTCESIKRKRKSCPNIPVEGCFCPDGQVLRNETCVVAKDCEVCDSEGHRPGDVWKKDKCTACTCEGTSLKCETEFCSGSEKICEQGYQVIKIPGKEDECCDKYACVPEPTAGPTCETPQPISCGNGQIIKLSTKPSGCQQFICECKPPEDCEPLDLTTDAPLGDGYVKTIDTSGCCPVAKLVCEKGLCPAPKQCQQFHTLKNVTESDRCCPLYTCEPPKDKCIYENEYTSDEKGGERARTNLEKQKLLKDANETWLDGPCRQCKCLPTAIGNYQPSCSQTDCSAIEISADYLDYDLIPEFVYDQCCPLVKRVACKVDEKIYQAGEKWTKDKDYCSISECVNGTNGVSKETTVSKCEKNCELGHEYIEPTPEFHQCCGTCKPYACVCEGLIREVGKEWSSPDFCVKYSCVSLNETFQIQSVKVNCPELSEDNLKNYEYESQSEEGECCRKYTPVACMEGGKVYQVGETWPSPDGDNCKKLTCVENENKEILKRESVETCRTDCAKGSEYKESHETCCGQCVSVACVVNDALKTPGENWTSDNGCTTFTCEHFGDEFSITSHKESCPMIEFCPEEDLYIKGCCRHCNITTAPQKDCLPEAIALNKTIGLIKTHRADHGQCVNKKAIDQFTECIGVCESATFFDKLKGVHENKCSCCQATKYESFEVDLECDDGQMIKKMVAVPSECSCQGCAASSKSTKSKKSASYVKM